MSSAAKAIMTTGAATTDGVVRKAMWRLMPLIMVSYFFAFFDRINIGFAKAQLQVDLGLSNTAYGLGASLFVIGYVLFEVPSNLILHRTGSRQWLARIMVSWGLATAAMMFAQGPWSFYALRFLVGALEAGFSPGVVFYMTLWFPASHRGRANSLLFLASACSGIFGAPIAGLILGHLNGAGGLPGWNWLFLFGGVPTMFLGLVIYRLLDNRPDEAAWLDTQEKALLEEAVGRAGSGEGHSMRAAITAPGFLLLALVYLLMQIASYGLNFWGPDLIRSSGIADPTVLGFLAAIPYLCGAVTMVVLARRCDASGRRLGAVIGCLLVAAIGFSMAASFAGSTWLVVLALALIGGGVVAAIPSFWALPPRLMAGVGAAGGIALINTIGQMGGIVSPAMVGWIKDHTGSTMPAMYAIAGAAVLAAALLAFLSPQSLRRADHG